VTSLPAHRSATGSALVNSNRQIASALGVAILVTLLGARIGAGSAGAFRFGWAIAAGLALLSAVAGAVLASRGRVPAPTPGALVDTEAEPANA
jgi:predicted anti-sigma-YlaC factor YlaD